MAAVSFNGVAKVYGDGTRAVDDLTLEIADGEFMVLVGPSGCGKTTALRMVAGFEEPTRGRVVVDGEDVTGRPVNRRDMGMVFQAYSLFPNMTARQNVEFGLRIRGRKDRASRAEELLELVGLGHAMDRYPHQLSGGMQQRVALARALAIEPRILLLDEPFGALDAKVRKDLRQWLRTLHDETKLTTIMVTHDQEEALSVADRIVVMNHGVIEQVGSPMEIYREPASPFVADFVGKVNVLPARVEGGLMQIGALQIPVAGADREARLYLRPEDVLARPITSNDAHVFEATIEKIEFLGSYCHVHVSSAALHPHRLTVYLSLNFLSEQSLQVGSTLPLKLVPERLKVF